MSAPFDPVKHGPAVWKLQGIRWNDTELGNARIFDKWPAERLAAVLGLALMDVEAIVGPVPEAVPTPPPARGFLGLPVTSRGLTPPPAGLEVRTRPLMSIYPSPRGGYTTVHAEAARAEHHPVLAGCPAQVVTATATHVLVRISPEALGDYHGDRLVVVPLPRFARYFAPLPGHGA